MESVALLFSDIEDSTGHVRRLGEHWLDVLARHRRICRAAWQRHGGEEMATEGDSFFVLFPRASDAVAAAVEAQQLLGREPWPRGAEVRTRIGLHHGEVQRHEQGCIGIDVHRAARVCDSAHGGQVVASAALLDAAGTLPASVAATDLGRHHLAGLGSRVHLFQLAAPDASTAFGPPRGTDPGGPKESGSTITVATIDNHEVVREGVAARLQAEPDLEVVASVGTIDEYLDPATEKAQVVLLDLWLDDGDATPHIPALRATGAQVLVCTTEERPDHLRRAVEAGAAGVLLKRDPVSTIMTGVRQAAATDFYCSSSLAHALLTVAPSGDLQQDERSILEALARGLSNEDIASGLGVPAADIRSRLVAVRDRLRGRRR